MKYSEAEIKTLRSQWMAGVPAVTIAAFMGRSPFSVMKTARRHDLPARGKKSPIRVPERRHASVIEREPIAVAPDRTAVAKGQTGALSVNLKRYVERDREGNEYVRPPAAVRGKFWEPLPGTTPVPLTENTGCKWPCGDGLPFTFCNAGKMAGRSYCEEHQRMAYQPKVTT